METGLESSQRNRGSANAIGRASLRGRASFGGGHRGSGEGLAVTGSSWGTQTDTEVDTGRRGSEAFQAGVSRAHRASRGGEQADGASAASSRTNTGDIDLPPNSDAKRGFSRQVSDDSQQSNNSKSRNSLSGTPKSPSKAPSKPDELLPGAEDADSDYGDLSDGEFDENVAYRGGNGRRFAVGGAGRWSGLQGAACGMGLQDAVGGGGGNLLDFVDEAADGISSYLVYLENREKGIVYNRHDNRERQRWREYLNEVCNTGNKRAQEGYDEPTSFLSARWPQGPIPRGGAPGCPPGSQDGPFSNSLDACLGPCAPPRNLVFEEADGVIKPEDGRSRLLFSSCFESGNLAFAKSDSGSQYTLLLDYDVNTCGYTQWFYFGVQGGLKGQKACFKITNMSKARSLFEDARMRPVVWSERSGRGWERGCEGVDYYPNEHKRQQQKGLAAGEGAAYYRTLEFSYTFEFEDDTVFFAYHYPYTYSYLQDFLAALCSHPYAGPLLKRGTMCWTIAGVPCEALEIDDPLAASEAHDQSTRPLAVVTARVHPGESNASWMMQGFLQFLCSPAPEAQALREACTWLVIPMLNPDGVIQGNYRCGLAGADLNRCFEKPHRRLHPTVWHLKERLRGRRIELYLDFHGHSRQEGIFFYGGKFEGGAYEERNAHVRLLPKLCALASSDFKYRCCSFNVQESKLTTARLVAFLRMGVLEAYTVEASFSCAGQETAEFRSDRLELDTQEDGDGERNSAKESNRESCGMRDAEQSSAMRAAAAEIAARAQAARDAEGSGRAASKESTGSGLCSGPSEDEQFQKDDAREGPNSRPQSKQSVRSWREDEQTCESALRSMICAPKLGANQLQRRPSAASLDSSNDSDSVRDPFVAYDSTAYAVSRQVTPEGIEVAWERSIRDGIIDDGRLQWGMTVPESNEASRRGSKEDGRWSPKEDADPRNIKKQVDAEYHDFVPSRLELVGPTIGRAIAACWQHSKGLIIPIKHVRDYIGLYDGYEGAAWQHLRYSRITGPVARNELHRLMNPMLRQQGGGDDEGGSDSNPSGDGKNDDDLKRIHRRILNKLKRRRDPLQNTEAKKKEEPQPQQMFRNIIAFGKTVRVPLSAGYKANRLKDVVKEATKQLGYSGRHKEERGDEVRQETKEKSVRPRSAGGTVQGEIAGQALKVANGEGLWVLDDAKKNENTPFGASDVRTFVDIKSMKPKSQFKRPSVTSTISAGATLTGAAQAAVSELSESRTAPPPQANMSARLQRLIQSQENPPRTCTNVGVRHFRLPETTDAVNYRPGSALHRVRINRDEDTSPGPGGVMFAPEQQQQGRSALPSNSGRRVGTSVSDGHDPTPHDNLGGSGVANKAAVMPCRVHAVSPSPFPESSPQAMVLSNGGGSSSSDRRPAKAAQVCRPAAIPAHIAAVHNQMNLILNPQPLPPRAAAAAAAAKAQLEALQQQQLPQQRQEPSPSGSDADLPVIARRSTDRQASPAANASGGCGVAAIQPHMVQPQFRQPDDIIRRPVSAGGLRAHNVARGSGPSSARGGGSETAAAKLAPREQPPPTLGGSTGTNTGAAPPAAAAAGGMSRGAAASATAGPRDSKGVATATARGAGTVQSVQVVFAKESAGGRAGAAALLPTGSVSRSARPATTHKQ